METIGAGRRGFFGLTDFSETEMTKRESLNEQKDLFGKNKNSIVKFVFVNPISPYEDPMKIFTYMLYKLNHI